MGKKAKITVDPAYKVGKIEEKLYGAFLEPIGDWVVGGIYERKYLEETDQYAAFLNSNQATTASSAAPGKAESREQRVKNTKLCMKNHRVPLDRGLPGG